MSGSVLVRDVRLVGLDGPTTGVVVDVRISDGVIVELGPRLRASGEVELDAAGGWALPGLWDAHVHFGQWVRSTTWLDVSGTSSAGEVCRRVAAALATRPDDGRALIGFGFRSGPWERPGTVAELDESTGSRPVALVAGDAHNGWLNTAALDLLGIPRRRDPLEENEWFEVFNQLDDLPGAVPGPAEESLAIRRLARRGITGIVDFEWRDSFVDWPRRAAAGAPSLRVRAGVYEGQLTEVLRSGLRTGDSLSDGGLITMGPLKIISDGSMGTRTAWCCEPYLDADPSDPAAFGASDLSAEHLTSLLRAAHGGGLEVAIHAIGDRANAVALDAFAASGARGSIEHAQLLRDPDVARFAALGIRASMQPHHLVDDRDAAGKLWGDRTSRLFRLRSLLDGGVELALGSDAPVSPPDPWLAAACAVHRSGDERSGWHQEEAITPREALAASVDGRRIAVGEPGDLVIVHHDPLAPEPDARTAADRLRITRVLSTVCAGHVAG